MLGDELQEQVSHFILDLYLYIHLYQYLYLYLYLHIYLYQYLYPSWCLATNYNGWSHQFNQPPRVDDIIWQNTKRQKYKPGDKLQEQFSPINLQEGGWYEIIEDDCCRQAKRTIRLRQFSQREGRCRRPLAARKWWVLTWWLLPIPSWSWCCFNPELMLMLMVPIPPSYWCWCSGYCCCWCAIFIMFPPNI